MYAVRLCSVVTVVELLSETFVSLVEIRPEDIVVVGQRVRMYSTADRCF